MITLKLKVDEKKILLRNIPERFRECNVDQLRCYAECFWPHRKKLFEIKDDNSVFVKEEYESLYQDIRMALLFSILQIKSASYLKLTAGHIHELLNTNNLVQFFFTSDWDVFENPVKSISGWTLLGTKTVHGPTIGFHHTCLEEFIFADKYYSQYKETEETEALDLLMSIFYRPMRNSGQTNLSADIRQDFHPDRTDDHIHIIARQPEWKKILFFMWYESNRQYLVNKYHEVFKPATEEGKKQPDVLDILLGFTSSITEFSQTKSANIYLIMANAQRNIKADRELAERMKKRD